MPLPYVQSSEVNAGQMNKLMETIDEQSPVNFIAKGYQHQVPTWYAAVRPVTKLIRHWQQITSPHKPWFHEMSFLDIWRHWTVSTWPCVLQISTPGTPFPRNVHTNFGFSVPFVVKLGARRGQTDGRNGEAYTMAQRHNKSRKSPLLCYMLPADKSSASTVNNAGAQTYEKQRYSLMEWSTQITFWPRITISWSQCTS